MEVEEVIPETEYLSAEQSQEMRSEYKKKTSAGRATALVKFLDVKTYEKYGVFTPQEVSDENLRWLREIRDKAIKIADSHAPLLINLPPKVFLRYRQKHKLPAKIQLPPSFYEYKTSPQNRIGIEIEMEEPPMNNPEDVEKYVKDLDKNIQELGFLIGYDALREIPLPPSSLENQLAAMAEMFNCNFILPGQELNTHINFENIQNPLKYIKQILLIHLCFSASGIFHRPMVDIELDYTGLNKAITDEELATWDQKFQGQPYGYPFKVRENGILEFRLINMKWEGFEKFSEGMIALYNIVQCFISYSKIKEGVEHSKHNQEKANLFEGFIEQTLYLIKNNLMSKISENKMNYDFESTINILGKFLYLSVLKSRKAKDIENTKFDEEINDLSHEIFDLVKVGNTDYSEEFLQILQDQYNSGSEFNILWGLINFSATKNPRFMNQLYEIITNTSNHVVMMNDN